MILFNLFDDWMDEVASFTCFMRLILLLRSLHVNIDRTKMILKPEKTTITKPNHIWPNLTPNEWVAVENDLKNLILSDYGKKNNVNVQALTQSEIKDIILGMDIAPPSLQKDQMAKIAEQQQVSAQQTAQLVKTTNERGEEVIVATRQPYEQ